MSVLLPAPLVARLHHHLCYDEWLMAGQMQLYICMTPLEPRLMPSHSTVYAELIIFEFIPFYYFECKSWAK